ncbi:hypothetical protein C2S52_019293 [Perilla frutescens var. hirtella]|nr:hypothetical protein C2S52_019293 [Perilla frutescens var. hirtella]
MASHCHHHSPAATSCYCHCYTPCHHHHPPPPPPDPHLHHLPNLYSPPSHPPNLPQFPQYFQQSYIQEKSQALESSLLLRIAALESALRRRSSPSQTLRDAAARSIQTHFRAFLVRRSITLRHLKDLASIKSSLGFLKSSVSGKTHFDYDVVYHKAANLLLKLDAIQGGDPMIRNGKISLNRELNKFLDFIEGVCVQRRTIGVNVRQSGNNVRSRVSNIGKKIGNVESGYSKRVNVEKLRGLVERIDRLAEELDEEQGDEIENPNDELIMKKYGVSAIPTGSLVKQHGGVGPKVKKSVSFAENGKVYKVLRRHSQPYLEEDDLDVDDDEKEFEDDLGREIEEIGVSSKEDVEEEVEDGCSSSDGEEESRRSSTSGGNFVRRPDRVDTGGSVFSAPSPVKMERRSN